MKKKVSTLKVKRATTSVRLFQSDRELMIAAAMAEGVSICEFLRRSLRERSGRILQLGMPEPEAPVSFNFEKYLQTK